MPDGWLLRPLASEVIGLDAGVSVNAEDRPHGLGEIGVLKTSALGGGVFQPSENKTVLSAERPRVRVSVRAESILVSRMNTPELVGETAFVPIDHPDLYLPDRIWQLRMRDADACSVRWLGHYLRSPRARAYIARMASGTSGSMKNLPKERFLAMPLQWPPLAEQRQIAAILDTIDDAIRDTEQIIAKLKQVKQGLVQDLLTRGIDDNGELRDPERHPEQFKRSRLGRIPRGWETARLADLVTSAVDGPFGSNLKTEHYVPQPGVRVVRLQNIGTGLFLAGDGAYVSERHGANLSRHEVRGGDMLVASLGDDRHPFGRACVYPHELLPGIVKADCFRLRCDQLLMVTEFAMHALNTAFWNKQLHGLGQGVTRDRVNLGNLLRVELPKPQLAEQLRTVSVLEAQQRRIEDEEKARSKLDLLKQGLMEDLLTGRVRVTEKAAE